MTLSMTSLSIMDLATTLSKNYSQPLCWVSPFIVMLYVAMLNAVMLSAIMLSVIMLSVIMLSVIMLNGIVPNWVSPFYCYTECNNVKCRYAECHYAEWHFTQPRACTIRLVLLSSNIWGKARSLPLEWNQFGGITRHVWVSYLAIKDITTILIMPVLTMTVLITLNMGDITYNDIAHNWLYL